jgi:hypothetical protein
MTRSKQEVLSVASSLTNNAVELLLKEILPLRSGENKTLNYRIKACVHIKRVHDIILFGTSIDEKDWNFLFVVRSEISLCIMLLFQAINLAAGSNSSCYIF